MKTISERIKKIVSEHLGVDYKMISEESNFAKDLGADSLDTVELIMAFEEEIGFLIMRTKRMTVPLFGHQSRKLKI